MARERAHGPYPHGNRWRIFVVGDGGKKTVASYETEAEARQILEATRAAIGSEERTIEDALNSYELALKQRRGEDKKASVYTTMARLRAIVGKVERSLTTLTPQRCAELYERYAASGCAVDTHRNALSEAKTFGKWTVKKKWMRKSGWEGVEGIGKRKKGKPQLGIDEARAWLRVAVKHADDGEAGAVAAMIALLCGLRSGEIVRLEARDVDDNGRQLWVQTSKTATGKRRLMVPEVLQPYLLDLKRDKLPAARLLGYHDRQWPSGWVERLCTKAGVQRVTAHGMRGLHGTLALDGGVSGAAVAASLGHASVTTTRGNYAEAGSAEREATLKTARALETPDQGLVSRTPFAAFDCRNAAEPVEVNGIEPMASRVRFQGLTLVTR